MRLGLRPAGPTPRRQRENSHKDGTFICVYRCKCVQPLKDWHLRSAHARSAVLAGPRSSNHRRWQPAPSASGGCQPWHISFGRFPLSPFCARKLVHLSSPHLTRFYLWLNLPYQCLRYLVNIAMKHQQQSSAILTVCLGLESRWGKPLCLPKIRISHMIKIWTVG